MSVEWIVTLVALVLTGGGVRVVALQRAQTERTTAEIRRLREIVVENKRVLVAVEALEASTSTVEVGTNIVQTAHHAIASIPFGVLEAIPVTAPVTKIVHEIHDQIADGVYGAITGVSRAIGRAGRRPHQPELPHNDAGPRQLEAPDD